jgi:endothelin-converting enzyme/putative endopeptidase
MKSLITFAVCSSLLFVVGCNEKTVTNKTVNVEKSAISTQKLTLSSGIEKANMDTSIRPQDNFYQYVNGGWLNANTIPSDKTSIGSFMDLYDEASENVKIIIKELAATPNLNQGSNEQKVADLFKSYMDIQTRDALEIKPIQSILSTISALNNKSDIAHFFGEHQSKGISNPLYFYISVDAKDSSNYATHIYQGGLGLPDKDYYFNEAERFTKLRNGYVKHIANMYKLAGLKNGEKAAQAILKFETQIADFHWTKVESRDSNKRYNKYAVSELSTLTDAFDWQTYLTAQGVSKQKNIIINQPSYIKGFGETFASTSLEDIKAYLTFHTLSSFATSLTTALDKENFEFYSKQLRGRQEQRPQWKRGVSVVNSNLGEVIGKVYVSKHFKPEAKVRMSNLVENLRTAYGKSIDNLVWMSDETKKAAHVKLAAFTPKIGYPDKWQEYSQLNISANDLVGNIIHAKQIKHKKEVAKLGGPIQKWEWGMTPQTVNAYYNPTVNEIVFPAAILQPPFFNMEADDAVNYGGIGAVIGHEMGHGFDDQGSKYDAKGNLKNWWTDADLAAFKERTDALVAQFDAFKAFDDLHVNGKLTLGENIGDLSGLSIAYIAYQASLNGQKAPVIDGLTGNQRFFMGWAQVWRGKMVEKSLRNLIATDPHSPGNFRALGILSNMPEFYKAFDVKEGDEMYIAPEKRVKIW